MHVFVIMLVCVPVCLYAGQFQVQDRLSPKASKLYQLVTGNPG